MKRTPLARTTPMKRGKALPRTGRLRVKGKRRFTRSADPAYLTWLHTLPCCVSGEWPVEAHHVRSKGAGGTDREAVPLSPRLHREGHRTGWRTFQAKYGVNLTALAERLAGTYEEA